VNARGDGRVDSVAGGAHPTVLAFPDLKGVLLVAA
jgi:hypothetical protein